MQQIGGFTNINYDKCAYDQRLKESVSPFMYLTTLNTKEHENRCTHQNKRYFKWNLVDTESELLNIHRDQTRCSDKKQPRHLAGNTLDAYRQQVRLTNPVVIDQGVCPIVFNNVNKCIGTGLPSLSNYYLK